MGEPTNGGNGSLQLETRWAKLGVNGRDIVLIAMLGMVGVGLIGMQLHTFRQFHETMVWGLESLKREVRDADQDRHQILSLLRLRTCSEVFLNELTRVTDPVKRASMERTWTILCWPPER